MHPARLPVLLATLCAAAAALLSPAVAGAHARRPARMRFTAPALIDHAGSSGRPIQALACPSTSLCVASDDTGSVVTDSDPADASTVWHVSRVDDAGGLNEQGSDSLVALACPSVRLCLGVDGDGGGLLSATRPTGGSAAWHRIELPGHPQLVAVACPRASLCLAADFAGGIDVSTRPTGPARDWTRTRLPVTGPQLSSLACPSVHLCVAGGTDGAIFESTDPARGGRSFHRVVVDSDPGATDVPTITDVACSSTSWCVADDDEGGLLTTSDPTGPPSGWTRTELDPGQDGAASAGLVAVTCRASGLCATVDPEGDVWSSPAAGAVFTEVATAAGNGESDAAIACPSQTLCVALGGSGDALQSSDPTTAGSFSSAPIPTNAGETLSGVSCPTASLCVAIDEAGNVLSTTTPTRARSWQVAAVDPSTALEAIDCPTTAFCAIADADGNVLTTSDPTGPASAWSSQLVAGPLESGSGTYPVELEGIACASAQLCITGDEDPGEILTSTDPTGPASAWSDQTGIGYRYGGDGLDGGSCSSMRFCATISGETILASTTPTGDTASQVMISQELDSISCTSRSLCAATQGRGSVDHGGGIWRSTDPAASRPKWRRVQRDPREQLGIACHATGLCVAVDSGGRAILSFSPRSTDGRWVSRDVDGLEALPAVSCPTSRECVAVDAIGRVLVGRR